MTAMLRNSVFLVLVTNILSRIEGHYWPEQLISRMLEHPEAQRLADDSRLMFPFEKLSLFSFVKYNGRELCYGEHRIILFIHLDKHTYKVCMFRVSGSACQEIGSCKNLGAFCSNNPNIVTLCRCTCNFDGCSLSNCMKPVTFFPAISTRPATTTIKRTTTTAAPTSTTPV